MFRLRLWKNASSQHKFKTAMKQPTLASFNFKRSSSDQDGPRPSKLEENIDTCSPSITYEHGPKKIKVFPSSWLSQFDLLGFYEKRGTMHLIFHFNETIDNNLCTKFLYPPFCTPNFTCQGVKKTQSKISVDTLNGLRP